MKPNSSRQEGRENPDPQELSRPTPLLVLGFALLMVLWGAWYILSSPHFVASEYGDARSLHDLRAKTKTLGAAGTADGAALYAARCAACHQASGAGLSGVFPPLAGSEWVLGAETVLIQILLHGAQGPLTVKGTIYNGAMPAFAAQLADAEIAALASHIRRQWGNSAAAITAETVAGQRKASANRKTPWQGDAELAALK